jgi:hypothetical protein
MIGEIASWAQVRRLLDDPNFDELLRGDLSAWAISDE